MSVLRRAALVVLAALPAVTGLVAVAPAATARTSYDGTTVTVTGRVSVTVATGPRQAQNSRHVSLTSNGRHYTLVGAESQPLASGSIVAASGTLTGTTLTVASTRVVAAATAVSTSGQQKVAAILAEWAGADSETTAELQAAVTDAGNWFDVVSAGRLTGFDVTTTNWVHIAAPSGCDQDSIADAAIAAAGITATSYDHVVVYFPDYASCSWAGLGDEPGRRVWLNGHTETSVLAHELGHNLGLWHAHALPCAAPGATGYDTATVSDDCVAPIEYGDPADTMGNEGGTGAPWFDAPHLAQLGWLGSDLTTTTPCAGAVHVAPYETPGSVRAIAVDAGAETHPQRPGVLTEPVTYWVEARQPTGYDAGLGSGLTDGVLVHVTEPWWDNGSPPRADYGTDLLDGTADANNTWADAAVTAGSQVVTPQGLTIHVDTVDGSGATVTLSTDRPSVPRSATVAANTAHSVEVSWQPPACSGGATIASYTVTALNDDGSLAATATTSGTSTELGIDPTTDRQIFVTAKNANGVTGATAIVPISAAAITDTVVYTSPSMDQFQVTITPSLANGGNRIIGYQVHCVGPDGDKGSYIPAGSTKTGTYPLTHGASYSLWVAPVIRTDGGEGPGSTPFTMVAGDDTAPTVAMTTGANTWRLASSVTVGWHGTDSGGLASYDVRRRGASATSGLGAWSYPAALQQTTTTSVVTPIAAGATVCWSVRARDHNGNTSGWSAAACWSRPLDDRSLSTGTGWSRGRGSAYYAGTITSTTHKSAVARRGKVHATAVLLVVTRCRTCGTVAVYEGTRLVKKLALTASTTRNRVQITVALPVKANGATISVKVLTSGKPVKLDALGLRAW
jgi:hypothetical protein